MRALLERMMANTISESSRGKKSVYDKLKMPFHLRPFDWARPAPMPNGHVPDAWRVRHEDGAKKWLASQFPSIDKKYKIYASGYAAGDGNLVIGLANNINRDEGDVAYDEIFKWLKRGGYPVKKAMRSGYIGYLVLMDDLKGEKRPSKQS